jgi:hypothetical protein
LPYMLQLSQIAELLHNIISPPSNLHELEIVSKSVSKNMTTQTQNPIFEIGFCVCKPLSLATEIS